MGPTSLTNHSKRLQPPETLLSGQDTGKWARDSDVWKIEQISHPVHYLGTAAPQTSDIRVLVYLPAIKRTADNNDAEHRSDLERSIHGIFNWIWREEERGTILVPLKMTVDSYNYWLHRAQVLIREPSCSCIYRGRDGPSRCECRQDHSILSSAGILRYLQPHSTHSSPRPSGSYSTNTWGRMKL